MSKKVHLATFENLPVNRVVAQAAPEVAPTALNDADASDVSGRNYLYVSVDGFVGGVTAWEGTLYLQRYISDTEFAWAAANNQTYSETTTFAERFDVTGARNAKFVVTSITGGTSVDVNQRVM